MPLPKLTAEQMAANRAKAHAATAAMRATVGLLKTDWLDAERWSEIAHDLGVRLPPMYLRPTPTLIRRYCRKLGISGPEFLQWSGYARIDEFAELNPRWPLRALVGVLCEYAIERNEARANLKANLRQS